MGVWTELVGVRRDMRLKGKWWHYVVIGFAVLSSLLVYIIVGTAIAKRPLKLDRSNTYSLTLLHHALSRTETTTLEDLAALPGIVATATPDGEIVPVPKGTRPDVLRCEPRPRYRADQVVNVGGVVYRVIPDRATQPASELRHCIAASQFANLTAESIGLYSPDGTERRRRNFRGFLAAIFSVMLWLVLYWNVYYRGLMPFYARYRRLRRSRRFHAHYPAR